MGPILRFSDWHSPQRRGPVCTWTGFTSSPSIYPLLQWWFSFFFFFFVYLSSWIPQLCHIYLLCLNFQIPQLVTLIYLILHTSIFTLLLFKHTSSDIYKLRIYLILWIFLCYNICLIPLGPKISAVVVLCSDGIKDPVWSLPHLASLNSFLVQSTLNCLVNYAFYHQETKYCSHEHCAKNIYIYLRFTCQTGLALGPHRYRRQMSLDHYIIDVSVKQIRVPGDNSFLSDWMHLRGLGPI